MKALSVLQPWAWLIVHGGKTVENRGWNTPYRGRLLIHASARASGESLYQARIWVQRELGVDVASKIPHLQNGGLRFGGIVGAVTLVDVVPPFDPPHDVWHNRGCFGFVLADPEPLPFRPAKGRLGLWGDWTIVAGAAVPLSEVA